MLVSGVACISSGGMSRPALWACLLAAGLCLAGCGDASDEQRAARRRTVPPWKETSGPLAAEQIQAANGFSHAILRFRDEFWYQRGVPPGEDGDGPWIDVTRRIDDPPRTGRCYAYVGGRDSLEAVAIGFVKAVKATDRDALVRLLSPHEEMTHDPLYDALVGVVSRDANARTGDMPLYQLDLVVMTWGDTEPAVCSFLVTTSRDSNDHRSYVWSSAPQEVVDNLDAAVEGCAPDPVETRVSTWDEPDEEAGDEEGPLVPKSLDDPNGRLEKVATPAGVFLGRWDETQTRFLAAGLGSLVYQDAWQWGDPGECFRQFVTMRSTVDRITVWPVDDRKGAPR